SVFWRYVVSSAWRRPILPGMFPPCEFTLACGCLGETRRAWGRATCFERMRGRIGVMRAGAARVYLARLGSGWQALDDAVGEGDGLDDARAQPGSAQEPVVLSVGPLPPAWGEDEHVDVAEQDRERFGRVVGDQAFDD